MKQANSNHKKHAHKSGRSGVKKREDQFFRSDAVDRPIVIRRKLTQVTNDTASTGNPFVFATTGTSVTFATEWANLSASYQSFRVRALKVTCVPVTRDNCNSAALIWYPGTLISGTYPVGSSAATTAAIFSENGSKIHPEWTLASHTVTWESNPSSRLWVACGTAIPAAQDYAIQFRGTVGAPLAYNGLVTHDVFVEWDVEFLGRA